MSHGHDKTYYVTDSDPRVQLSVPDATSHLWTIRKNVSGRLWYTHNSTGLKTHIKPTAAALSGYSGLPAGWEERRTPDGRTYFFNRKMGSSSWTKPANSLPDGWKELRTPDLVPFYINESLGLSTWDRPGQQPRKRPGQSNKVVTRSRPGQPNSNQNTGDAILSATINAARLTGHGVEVASRQMGKLGKKKNWKKMGRIMTQASGLSTGDSDGGGGGGYSSDEGGYEEQGQYQENLGFQQAAFSEQQSFAEGGQQQQSEYQQPIYEQQTTYQYSAQQEQPVFEQPAQYDNTGQFSYPGNESQQGYEQQQEQQYQYGQNPAYEQQPVQEQQQVPQQPAEQPQYYTQEAQQQPGQQQPVMPQEQPQYYPQEAQQQPAQQPIPQQPVLPQEQPQYYPQEAQQQPVQQPAQQQLASFDLGMPPDQSDGLPPQIPQEPYMPPQPSQQTPVTNQVPTTQAPMYPIQQPFFYDPAPTTQAQVTVTYQSPVYSPTYIPPEQSQLPHNNQPEVITSDVPLVETYNSDSTTVFVDNNSFVTGSGQQNTVNEPTGTIPDNQGDIVVEVTIQQQLEPLDVPSQPSLEIISTPEPLIIQNNDHEPDSTLVAQSTQPQGDMDASAACLALI
ncbi:hypothetical protein N0V84_006698 [Fusarium piperis]|uniref:WW domain-containing protein n=1 Tax=Fusarium piperis TaxID=1435070 RepID=A0A9W9BMM0_9HYPO|nr:hypothetical protein N0V84_006698 [Fusarium piperis]